MPFKVKAEAFVGFMQDPELFSYLEVESWWKGLCF